MSYFTKMKKRLEEQYNLEQNSAKAQKVTPKAKKEITKNTEDEKK